MSQNAIVFYTSGVRVGYVVPCAMTAVLQPPKKPFRSNLLPSFLSSGPPRRGRRAEGGQGRPGRERPADADLLQEGAPPRRPALALLRGGVRVPGRLQHRQDSAPELSGGNLGQVSMGWMDEWVVVRGAP